MWRKFYQSVLSQSNLGKITFGNTVSFLFKILTFFSKLYFWISGWDFSKMNFLVLLKFHPFLLVRILWWLNKEFFINLFYEAVGSLFFAPKLYFFHITRPKIQISFFFSFSYTHVKKSFTSLLDILHNSRWTECGNDEIFPEICGVLLLRDLDRPYVYC